jgi:3-methyladenine DNA glycosylase AlkD
MQIKEVLDILKSHANPASVKGMARFGINPANTLGISIPFLRKLAKETGKDHVLAAALWGSGIHEARILAGMVDDAKQVTATQMDTWAEDFDSWDVCDQVCMNLFAKTSYALNKAAAWADRPEEFVKRAGFALMACVAWADKKAGDDQIAAFLPIIEHGSCDERNYVKKAVNWALRQVGKRNLHLNKLAIEASERIKLQNSKSARWIASDALSELTGDKVQATLSKKSS